MEEETSKMLRDARGRFLKGTRPPTHTLITAENSSEFHRAWREKKQVAVLDAADAFARLDAEKADPRLRKIVAGEMPAMRAITVGRMAAAMDASNPYGNGAASWIVEHAGLAERPSGTEAAGDPLRDALASLFIEYARRVVAGEIVTRTEHENELGLAETSNRLDGFQRARGGAGPRVLSATPKTPHIYNTPRKNPGIF